MELTTFAERHSLKVRRDSCGDEIIPGKPRSAARQEDRCHLYDNGDDRFGIVLLVDSVGKWHNRRDRLVAAGFTVVQDGHGEGTLLFNPADSKQVRAAIKEAGLRIRKPATPAQLAALAKAQAARQPQSGKPLEKVPLTA